MSTPPPTPPPSQEISGFQQLRALLPHVQHALPMLPPDATSFVHTTYHKEGFQHFPESNELETGTILGYLANRTQFPHPFVWRRDFMLNQSGKIGGFPSWLIPQNLPSTICPHCTQPMTFLLQFSAPISSPDPGDDFEGQTQSPSFQKQQTLSNNTAHRMLYLFVCTDSKCAILNNSVKVFRAQLPLLNPHYKSEPTEYLPKSTPQSHDFRYPFDSLSSTDDSSTSSSTFSLCILCGGKATLPCDTHGPTSTTPIYCSELHKQFNLKHFKINSTTPLTLTTHPPTPATTTTPASPLVTNGQSQNLLESTVLFPRFGLRTDFEVLDDDAMTVFQDELDLQIQRLHDKLNQPEGPQIGPVNESVEANAEATETSTCTSNTTTPPTESESVAADFEATNSTSTSTTTPPTDDTPLNEDAAFVQQHLSDIADPQLRASVEAYLKEEKAKSMSELAQDAETFPVSLDETETDSRNVVAADAVFTSFQRRIDLTLPPLVDDPMTPADITAIKTIQFYKDYNKLSTLPNNSLSQQILRYYPYSTRTQHPNLEPLWIHQYNRLHINDYSLKPSTTTTPTDSTTTPLPTDELPDVTPHASDCLKCSHCGARRVLEAQVMPFLCTFLFEAIGKRLGSLKGANQKLAKNISTTLQLEQFDFATIAIFTCSESCSGSSAEQYSEEFAYLQPTFY